MPLIAVVGGIAAAIAVVNGVVAISTAVTAAYNAVLLANPFVLVAGLVIALGAALVVAYKKSETFRDIVDAAFAKVKAAGKALADFVTETIPKAFNTVKDKVTGAAEAVKTNVGKAWTAIKDAIPAAWNAVRDAVVTAVGTLVTYIAGRPAQFVENVQLIWTAIRNAVAGAWGFIRDALGAAFTVLLEYIKGYPANFVANMQLIWTAVRNAIPAAFGLIRDKIGDAFTGKGGILDKVKGFGKDIVDAIVDGIKGAGSLIESTVKGLLNKLPGIDFKIGGDGPGVGGTPEGQPRGVKAMMAALPAGTRLISGFRPGAITATGNPSYHGKGRAVDLPPSMALFNYIKERFGSVAKELIFSPAGGRQVHNGREHYYSGVTRANHFDHVHWAMANGGVINEEVRGIGLSSGKSYAFGERGPETVTPGLPDSGIVAGDLQTLIALQQRTNDLLERIPRSMLTAARAGV